MGGKDKKGGRADAEGGKAAGRGKAGSTSKNQQQDFISGSAEDAQNYSKEDKWRPNNCLDFPFNKPYEFSFRLYGRMTTVQVDQRPESDIGGMLWDAGYILAAFLTQNKDVFPISAINGKRVIELGAGTGLCSLVAHALGASLSVATDVEEVVCDVLDHNVRQYVASNVKDKARKKTIVAAPLYWGNEDHIEQCLALSGGSSHISAGYDVVMAADVAYRSEQYENLFRTMVALATPPPPAPSSQQVSSRNSGSPSTNPSREAQSTSGEAGGSSVATHAGQKQGKGQQGGSGKRASGGRGSCASGGAPLVVYVHRQRLFNEDIFMEPLLEAFDVEAELNGQEVVPQYPKPTTKILLLRIKQ